MDPKLMKVLQDGGVVVGATERLASSLLAAYDRRMLAQGNRAWATPAIFSWERWMADLWRSTYDPRTVIGDQAAEVLWEEVILEDCKANGVDLLDVSATALLAIEARNILSLYGISREEDFSGTPECASFLRWHDSYVAGLRQRLFLDRTDVGDQLVEKVLAGELAVVPSIALTGFDESVPLREKLLGGFRKRGAEVFYHVDPVIDCTAGVYEAPDPEVEVLAAASWAVNLLEMNPRAKLGVVCLELQNYAPLVERVFTAMIMPYKTLGLAPGDPLHDISLGGSLGGEPVVHTALELLSLPITHLDLAKWRNLLLSPHWGPLPSRSVNPAVGRALLRLSNPEPSMNWVLSNLNGGHLGRVPGADRLYPMLKGLVDELWVESALPPSEWGARFAKALDFCGWATPSELGSREFQAVEKFNSALDSLRSLDELRPLCDAGWAYSRLKRLLDQPFRPEVTDPPIRVMGALEAAGMTFDGVWVLGCTGSALPSEIRPNPFIPYVLQLRAGVRQASPELEHNRAKNVMDRLCKSGTETVLSWTTMVEGVLQTPSPFLAGLPRIHPRFSKDFTPVAQVRALPQPYLERLEDLPDPVSTEETVQGSSRLFALQAQCPFRAFAELRLKIEPTFEATPGIDASTRGSMLHEALKALHGRFHSRDLIEKATESEVEQAVDTAVGLGLAAWAGQSESQAYAALEAERIRGILFQWLDVERQRPDFEVLEREAVKKLLVCGIPVSLRVDRVDSVPGGEVILDYKSGSRSTPLSTLSANRLVEPQLPLYALACPEATGIAYVKMAAGECKVNGIEADGTEGGLKSVSDWAARREEWREKMDGLAKEFLEGRADTDPLGKRKFCSYCGLPSLCRLEPKTESGQEDEG